MYVKTTCGNFFEVAKAEEFESGSVWKIKSTIYDGNFIYYDYSLGIVMIYDIEYEMEMEEKEYVIELAKWLLRNIKSNSACDLFLKWGKDHGWSFTIRNGKVIFGTNGKEVVMVSGGTNVSWDM